MNVRYNYNKQFDFPNIIPYLTVLTDLMLSSMARKNRPVLKFIHKVMRKNIKKYLMQMDNFRGQLRTEVGIDQKSIDKWKGFQAEPQDQ